VTQVSIIKTWLFLEDFPFFPRIDLTTEQITLAKTKNGKIRMLLLKGEVLKLLKIRGTLTSFWYKKSIISEY
jgi:hypothetical protein